MSLIANSVIVNFISKFDIDDSCVQRSLDNSFLFQKCKDFFSIMQEKSESFVKGSLFFNVIDYIILGLITVLIFVSTFASTKVLGLIAIASFLLAAIKLVFVKENQNYTSSFHIPVFLYFAIAAISVAYSYLLFPSIKGYAKMIVYLGSYITFFSSLKGSNSFGRILYIISMLGLATGLESIVAIFQKFAGVEALATWQDKTSVNPEQLMNRVYGTLQPYNPNLLAGFLIAGFSSALGAGFVWLKKQNIYRGLVFLLLAALTLVAIVLTGSRGAYIALASILAVFVMISGHIIWHDFSDKTWIKRLWVWTIVLGVVGVLAIVAISPSIQHRIASIFTLRGDSSNSFRMNVYISSFKMFLDNWLIGIGPGNTTFRLMYGLYMVTGFDALGTYCVPLEIAVESGIFALLSFGWLILMSFIRGIKNICEQLSFEQKVITSVCVMALVGMLVHGFVDTVWYRPQIQFLFWLYIAILAIITSNSFKAEDATDE